jgi:hypothetical protein
MLWVILLAAAATAAADPVVQVKMFDSNGNPTTFASRPGIYFQICLVQPSAFTVTGLKTESTHFLLRSEPGSKLLKVADYDDLEPYLTPLTHTIECVNFGIAIGNIWKHYFGLDAGTDPASVSFMLHAPLQLALNGAVAAQQTVTATPGIVFGCHLGCHTLDDSATTADAVVGWTLLALFFVLVVICFWWAVSMDNAAAEIMPTKQQRVELVIRDERGKA